MGYEIVVANEARSDELAIIIKYQTSASIIIVFLIIKNAHRVSRILPDFICKNNRFLACFFILGDAYSYHVWRAWYNGSYNMMAKPPEEL